MPAPQQLLHCGVQHKVQQLCVCPAAMLQHKAQQNGNSEAK
jgi:hypothetical protein